MVILKGRGASKGIVSGTVVIAFDPEEGLKKVEKVENPVLVTLMTDPNFVPLFKRVKGVITEIGSILSHAAIVSREMDLPCIVGVLDVTQTLKDGMKIKMDGISGEIKYDNSS